MERIFLDLLNLSLTAGCLIAAILLLRPLFKKAPRWMCCALWGLVALRLLCPFSIESTLSIAPRTELVSEAIGYDRPTTEPIAPSVESEAPTVTPTVPSTTPQTSPSPATPAPVTTKTPVQAAVTAATWAWLCGAVSLLLYGLSSTLRLRNRLRTAVREEENVWLSDRVAAPFVMGLFRPRIYLPFDLSNEERALVLAHERAHLARGDHFGKALGFFLLSVHWFNPLMWVAYSLLCRDMELACDERATKAMDDEARRAYSSALLNYTIRRPFIAAAPLAFGAVGTKERVKHVLKYKKPTIWIVALAVVACVLLTIGFMTVPKTDAQVTAPFRVLEADSDMEGVSLSLLSLVMREGTVYAQVETTIDKAPYRGDFQITTYPDATSLYRQEGEAWVDCRTTPADTTVTATSESGRGDTDKKTVIHHTFSLADFDCSKAGVYRLERKIDLGNANGANTQSVAMSITFECDGAETMVNHTDGSTFYPADCVYLAEEGDFAEALQAEQEKAHLFAKRVSADKSRVFQVGEWSIEDGNLVRVEADNLPFSTVGYETVYGRRLLDANGNDTGYRFYTPDCSLADFSLGNAPLWFAYFEGDTCTAAYRMQPCGNTRDVALMYSLMVQPDELG